MNLLLCFLFYRAHQCAAFQSITIEVLVLFCIIKNHIFPHIASKKTLFYYTGRDIVLAVQMLTITKIKLGAFSANCYVVRSEDFDALVVDPGADGGAISKIIGHCRLTVRGYLLTHGHIDHIGALSELRGQIPAPVFMHGADSRWAFSSANHLLPYYAAPPRAEAVEHVLKGGEKWREYAFNLEVIATPGHSPGGVCYYFPDDNLLFSGDTLFRDSIGRTDLPAGDAQQLNASLAALARLPPRTKVYPGHGPETTIGRELEHNPFLQPR